nr:retrovirus-related Pol polyprotein from transposon TNT 1-94 [Tanacetum cinerariifolium]
MGYDQEMVPKTKDWVERLNPDRKLPNFNTGRILVPESQVVNESFKTLNTPKSFKDFKAKFLTLQPPLKTFRELLQAQRERILDISYFHVFRCLVFIYNHKDHLGKFDAKADDGYFLGYSFVSKAFRVYNTRRQQIEETYHVTFDESIEAIRFTNTSVDKRKIDDSSRYPPGEFLHEDDPSRQYQVDFDISYYGIPRRRSLIELTQENHVPEVIVPNEHDVPLTEDIEDPPDLIRIERTHEQNIQDD